MNMFTACVICVHTADRVAVQEAQFLCRPDPVGGATDGSTLKTKCP